MVRDKNHDVNELKTFAQDLLRQAGQIALAYYGKGRADIRFDEDLLTSAELKLNELFIERLEGSYPEHQVFRNTQDDTSYSHEEKRYLWVFDPIDGADNYQTGIPVWGSSIALLENFWPIFGMFHMPATGDFFHASAGAAAYWGDKKIHISHRNTTDNESLLFTYSRFHHHFQTDFPGKLRDLGCATAHVCYIAMGRAEAAIISNESFQGLAAARVIIESAGAKIMKLDGSDFFLNEYLDGRKIGDHLLVTAPGNFNEVSACLKKS
jgi:myo-inositol-1(or 4)-monophosphatase